jgi:hypothetical protein
MRAPYVLELDTRAWIRNFKSKSVVAWLALALSIVSLTISICSFVIATKESVKSPQETKGH